jgi:hypothetical protein
MNSRLVPLALAALFGAVGLSGCESCCHRSTVAARPYCANCLDTIQPPRIVPMPLPAGAPGGAVDATAPATYLTPPPPSSPPAAELGSPVPAPPDGAAPRAVGPPTVRLLPPGPRRESARIPPDSTKEPPIASVPEKPAPKVDEERERETPAPIDIPGFALARPNVATGLRPFPDGIDWLKARGYKVVLHLRAPGEDNAAAQREFDKRGLRYTSLEVSPARLSKELYEDFVSRVTDTKNHPLFVYDKDGSSAGGLWYLYFRVHQKQSDEKARAEAERLGLRFDDDVEHKTMWLAAQTLLKKLLPEG